MNLCLKRALSLFVLAAFFVNSIIPPAYAQALPNLPVPGAMLPLSTPFSPAIMTGMTIHPENPLKFSFIINTGDDNLQGEELKRESQKLINYFMASLTVPEDEMWVNLSPYEKNRIIADGLGQTEIGRDMLAQDYLLKQLTASLIYPEEGVGKEFWAKIYEQAQTKFGTTDVPTNLFNKVWIVPEEASVYVHENNVFVTQSHLKVMLEQDYLALEMNKDSSKHGLGSVAKNDIQTFEGQSAQIIREIILPEIEKEVNEGKNFANLRQIYNSMILATWYKKKLRNSFLDEVYLNKNKTNGIELQDKNIKDKIYNQYLEAFKKGVYDYIKEDYDSNTQEVVSRKYFSGGLKGVSQAILTEGQPSEEWVRRYRNNVVADVDAAMMGEDGKIQSIASNSDADEEMRNDSAMIGSNLPAETIAIFDTAGLNAKYSPISLWSLRYYRGKFYTKAGPKGKGDDVLLEVDSKGQVREISSFQYFDGSLFREVAFNDQYLYVVGEGMGRNWVEYQLRQVSLLDGSQKIITVPNQGTPLYVVSSGDAFYLIARRNGSILLDVYKLNSTSDRLVLDRKVTDFFNLRFRPNFKLENFIYHRGAYYFNLGKSLIKLTLGETVSLKEIDLPVSWAFEMISDGENIYFSAQTYQDKRVILRVSPSDEVSEIKLLQGKGRKGQSYRQINFKTSYKNKLYFLDYLPNEKGEVFTNDDVMNSRRRPPPERSPLVLFSYTDKDGVQVVSPKDLKGDSYYGGPRGLIGTPEGLFLLHDGGLNVQSLIDSKEYSELQWGGGLSLMRFIDSEGVGENFVVSLWGDDHKPDSLSAQTGEALTSKLTSYLTINPSQVENLVGDLGERDAFILKELLLRNPSQRFNALSAFQELMGDQVISKESGEGLIRWLYKRKKLNFVQGSAVNVDAAMLEKESRKDQAMLAQVSREQAQQLFRNLIGDKKFGKYMSILYQPDGDPWTSNSLELRESESVEEFASRNRLALAGSLGGFNLSNPRDFREFENLSVELLMELAGKPDSYIIPGQRFYTKEMILNFSLRDYPVVRGDSVGFVPRRAMSHMQFANVIQGRARGVLPRPKFSGVDTKNRVVYISNVDYRADKILKVLNNLIKHERRIHTVLLRLREVHPKLKAVVMAIDHPLSPLQEDEKAIIVALLDEMEKELKGVFYGFGEEPPAEAGATESFDYENKYYVVTNKPVLWPFTTEFMLSKLSQRVEDWLENKKNSIERQLAKPDQAMMSAPGGIDFNAKSLNLKEQGQLTDIKFSTDHLENIQPNSINGILPVIINITPVVNFPMLLGLSNEKAQEFSQL